MAQYSFEHLTSSDYDVALIPTTTDYAPALYGLIDENRDHLSQFDDNTARRFPTEVSLVRAIESLEDSDTELYTILSKGVVAGSVNVTPVSNSGDVVEIGFWVGGSRDFLRKNIGSSAVSLITGHLLERPSVEEVVAYTHPDNIACQKTLQRADFLYFGLQGEPGDEQAKYFKNRY